MIEVTTERQRVGREGGRANGLSKQNSMAKVDAIRPSAAMVIDVKTASTISERGERHWREHSEEVCGNGDARSPEKLDTITKGRK